MDMQQIITLKSLATGWVDLYWESGTPMTYNEKAHIKLRMTMDGSDDRWPVPDTGLNRETTLVLILQRCEHHNVRITEKALQFLALLVSRPAEISMLMAAIVHVQRAVDIEKMNLITYKWLTFLIEDKLLSEDTAKTLWDNQKLANGTNLMDYANAFELLTTEELEFMGNLNPLLDLADEEAESEAEEK